MQNFGRQFHEFVFGILKISMQIGIPVKVIEICARYLWKEANGWRPLLMEIQAAFY